MKFSHGRLLKAVIPALLFFLSLGLSAGLFAQEKKSLFISTQQEIQIGREASQRFEKQYGLYTDPAALSRVGNLARRLVSICDRKTISYTFKIANSDEFNACAFPGGFIYVNKGVLKELNDGELAFILGHELAHVCRRHSVKQIEKNLVTGGLLTLIASIVNKGRLNEGTVNTITAINTVIQSSYSREDERQADQDSLRYLKLAGINPAWGVSALRKMQKKSGGMPGFLNTLIGSHPMPDERVRDAEGTCRALGFDPATPSEIYLPKP